MTTVAPHVEPADTPTLRSATLPPPTAAAKLLVAFVRFYQIALSWLLGGRCRFRPSCSHYAIACLTRLGAMRGSLLTIRRLSRCHPWGGHGDDPPPSA